MFHNLKSQRTLDNSTLPLTLNKIEILNKNIIYITHQVDAVLKRITNLDLKLQTIEFYLTSPQTDTEEQDAPNRNSN